MPATDPRSSPRWPIMLAVLDRIIPADEFPSATQARVDAFVAHVLSNELADRWMAVEKGLSILDEFSLAAEGAQFAALDPVAQDQVLNAVELGQVAGDWPVPPTRWFRMLCNLAAEGYYGDPGNGGNPNMTSWKMVGYDPGLAGNRW